MRYIFTAKRFFLSLLFMIVSFTTAYSQKDTISTGTLSVIHQNGSRQQVSLAYGVTIRGISCDSVYINGVWYYTGGGTTIIPHPCDSVSKTSIQLPPVVDLGVLDINVYPNPSNGLVKFIVTTPQSEEVTVQVYNTLGNLVKQYNPFKTTESSVVLSWDFTSPDGTDLSVGTYFIRASTSKNIITRSIKFSK